jgi:hypothetical protein
VAAVESNNLNIMIFQTSSFMNLGFTIVYYYPQISTTSLKLEHHYTMSPSEGTPTKPFRVIVIGAGIVGLSLSHALQLANIEHVVLEKHHEIVSVRGAALIIWPGVMRIFDQFGILEKIHATTTPISAAYRRWPDGSVHSHAGTVKKMDELYVHAPGPSEIV